MFPEHNYDPVHFFAPSMVWSRGFCCTMSTSRSGGPDDIKDMAGIGLQWPRGPVGVVLHPHTHLRPSSFGSRCVPVLDRNMGVRFFFIFWNTKSRYERTSAELVYQKKLGQTRIGTIVKEQLCYHHVTFVACCSDCCLAFSVCLIHFRTLSN